MLDLDDLDYGLADPGDVLRELAGAGGRVRQGAGAAAVDLGAADGRPRTLVVVAAGEERDAASAVVALAGAACPVPVVVGRHVPGYVGPLDLVAVLDTASQLPVLGSAVDEAARRGSRMLTVCAEDSPLAGPTRSARGSLVELPRGASPYWGSLLPAALAGAGVGLLGLTAEDVEATAARLDAVAIACRPDAEIFANPAKTLAGDLAEGVPLVWGTTGVAAAAAHRGATQLRSRAGVPATAALLADALTGDVQLLESAGAAASSDPLEDLFRDRVDDPERTPTVLVLLRDEAEEDPGAAAAADAVAAYARGAGVFVHEVAAAGESRLERLASLAGLLDLAAAYTACARGVDPGRALRAFPA